MRTLIIVSAICVLVGAFFGYKFAINKHDKLLISVQETHLAAIKKEQEKANEYKALSEKHYKSYIDASNVEPIVITDRVYVKAKCEPLPDHSSGGVGNGGGDQIAELHRETIDRITAVTNRAEQDVLKCRAKLHSLQDKIKLFNIGK